MARTAPTDTRPPRKAALKRASAPAKKATPPRTVKPAVKRSAKPMAKAATKPAVKPAAKPAVKAAHKTKQKPVRDSFTMPKADFDLIDGLKQRALSFKHPVKKSELLRAGLHALAKLDDAQLAAIIAQLVKIKAGRPKSSS